MSVLTAATRGLSLIVGFGLLAGCAAPGTLPAMAASISLPASATPTASTAPQPPSCDASGIVVRTAGRDAALGLRVLTVELENCGTDDVALHGYPTVRVLDSSCTPLDIDIVNGVTAIPDPGPHDITVPPGGRAHFAAVWRNTVEDPSTPIPDARYLDVRPTRDQPAHVVDPGSRIDLGTTGRLSLSAWSR